MTFPQTPSGWWIIPLSCLAAVCWFAFIFALIRWGV